MKKRSHDFLANPSPETREGVNMAIGRYNAALLVTTIELQALTNEWAAAGNALGKDYQDRHDYLDAQLVDLRSQRQELLQCMDTIQSRLAASALADTE